MAGSSTVVDLLIKARDLASAPSRGIVASIKFLDSEISVVAGKIRDAFSGLFGGGLDGAIEFEAQLSKVAAKGGFTAAEMAKLNQAAADIGAKAGVTGTEAAQSMEALAAAGLIWSDELKGRPITLTLHDGRTIAVAPRHDGDGPLSVEPLPVYKSLAPADPAGILYAGRLIEV